MAEMTALRLQNEELKAEVGRLKETRAAIYKLYLESKGKSNVGQILSRNNVFEALKLSADEEEPAPHSQGPHISWKAEYEAKIKQRVLRDDGTPKDKAEYGGIQAVYRAVKEEVGAESEFVTDRQFRKHAEQILKVAQDAEDARLALARANVET